LKFFFDENISQHLVRALRCLEGNAGVTLDHLLDKYQPERRPVADTTFIPEMTKEGYVIITADHAQKKTRGKHAVESAAYRDSDAIAFWLPKRFVNPGKKSHDIAPSYRFTQASLLFGWWLGIKQTAERANPRDLFDVQLNGKIVPRRP
jgi:hypothetical protein